MQHRSGQIHPSAKKIIARKKNNFNAVHWAHEIKKGNISILAQAITRIESHADEDRKQADQLLKKCYVRSNTTMRLGITGPPGVGKSSFIENLGQSMMQKKSGKLAVLTIDPTSPIQGGSILGDKTRMQTLSSIPDVFIRPSPSGDDDTGGIHLRTREVIQLLEYAGYNYMLIETVGVGQSEYTVKDITDFTVLLIAPGGGDELQGIKRGINEIADLIVVTKDDSGMESAAGLIQTQYQNALKLFHNQTDNANLPDRKVMKCSNLSHKGIDAIVTHLFDLMAISKKLGVWSKKRNLQKKTALHTMVRYLWLKELYSYSSMKELKTIETKVSVSNVTIPELSKAYLRVLRKKLA